MRRVLAEFVARHSHAARMAGTVHDMVVAALVFVAAHFAVLGGSTFAMPNFAGKLIGFTLGAIAVFYLFSLNSGSWRYASIPDLLGIVKASVTLAAGYTIVMFIAERGYYLPRLVPILIAVLLMLALGGPRILYRIIKESGPRAFFAEFDTAEPDARYVLVHTLNECADHFIRTMQASTNAGIRVAGVIDDRPEKYMQQIRGVSVFGGAEDLAAILERLKTRGRVVSEIVIADSTMTPNRLGEVVELAIANGLSVSRLPDIGARRELRQNDVVEVKPINLADLLGRKEIRIDTIGVAQMISGKTVLITGAGGSIGAEISRQIAQFAPKRLILTDNSEFHLYKIGTEIADLSPTVPLDELILDVRDRKRVDTVLATQKPDVIFHAAALKHVPVVEANRLEGIKTNVMGTRNLADAAVANGVQTFVLISTDKAVNPTNVMGATKRAAEAYCQSLDLVSERTRFKTVRFGNVLGSNGSVVPRFREQIERGGPVTVTHPEIERFFMSIPEAVRLVLQASGHGLSAPAQRGRILVLDMGQPVKIVDLARKMIMLAGFKPGVDIKIVYTGLRPGEKLYEELFDEAETVETGREAGHATAAPRAISRKAMLRNIKDMEAACAAEDGKQAMALLRQIVPEYRPSPTGGPRRESAVKSQAAALGAFPAANAPDGAGRGKLH